MTMGNNYRYVIIDINMDMATDITIDITTDITIDTTTDLTVSSYGLWLEKRW